MRTPLDRYYAEMNARREKQTPIEYEDGLHEFYIEAGAVYGTPGSLTPDEVRETLQDIQSNDALSDDQKFDALTHLDVFATNNLEFGQCDPVIGEILVAQREYVK